MMDLEKEMGMGILGKTGAGGGEAGAGAGTVRMCIHKVDMTAMQLESDLIEGGKWGWHLSGPC